MLFGETCQCITVLNLEYQQFKVTPNWKQVPTVAVRAFGMCFMFCLMFYIVYGPTTKVKVPKEPDLFENYVLIWFCKSIYIYLLKSGLKIPYASHMAFLPCIIRPGSKEIRL